MADTFMDKRAKMAEDEINSHFSCIKFKLFEPQVNGGMKEVCEPLIPNRDGQMVDYKSANTAAQIKIIERIKTFILRISAKAKENLYNPTET